MRSPTTAMKARQRMLTSSRVIRLSNHMPLPIMSLISLEMVELLRSPTRRRAVIPMMRVIPIVYMSMKSTRPMEPRPGSNKDPTRKPIRPIIPIRRAIIRRIVEITIRAFRRNSNPDDNL